MTKRDELDKGDSLAGRLIIAMPNIGDPRFERSVIYLFAHQEDGAMGLIVNQPADDLSIDDLLDQLDLDIEGDGPTTQVRVGGPVEMERGFVLHSDDYRASDATMKVDDGISVSTTVDILKAIATGDGPEKVLLALGYAGWGPGQLEREILENGWLHCEADVDIVFDDDDETKWSRALAKIGVNPSALSSASGSA